MGLSIRPKIVNRIQNLKTGKYFFFSSNDSNSLAAGMRALKSRHNQFQFR